MLTRLFFSLQRPEIRAPKFDVKYHDRRLVSPGYWFVAPYTVLEPEPPTKKWMPCQVGPHIYDADGVSYTDIHTMDTGADPGRR